MKYIKAYEKLNIAKFSNLDKILDSVKNKLLNEIEKEFSKYLSPTNIILNNKEVKAFLLKPDFGIYFILDFIYQPYRIDINIHIINKRLIWRLIWIKIPVHYTIREKFCTHVIKMVALLQLSKI